MDRFKSRKFVFLLIVFVVSLVALFLKIANFDSWADFIKWIFGAYILGNIGEHYTRSQLEQKKVWFNKNGKRDVKKNT